MRRLNLAELLIARGADVNAATHSGKTPLDLAKFVLASMGDADKRMIDLLKKHGAR